MASEGPADRSRSRKPAGVDNKAAGLIGESGYRPRGASDSMSDSGATGNGLPGGSYVGENVAYRAPSGLRRRL